MKKVSKKETKNKKMKMKTKQTFNSKINQKQLMWLCKNSNNKKIRTNKEVKIHKVAWQTDKINKAVLAIWVLCSNFMTMVKNVMKRHKKI